MEIVIALAVLAVLLTMAAPVLKLSAQRQKESELRAALRDIRSALDAYKLAVAERRVKVTADASGYPEHLEDLVAGVPNLADPAGGRIYFLRRMPRDPFDERTGISPASTWATRSYASPLERPAEGADVFDVRSRASGMGLNGVPYREW